MKNEENLIDKISNLIKDTIEELDCELVEIKYHTEGNHKVLLVIIDKEDGVGIDDCSDVSGAIEPLIDSADLINFSYDLEVSSPGIDRPLVSVRDFEKNMGKLMEIILKNSVSGKDKFEGKMIKADELEVVIILDEPFIKGRKPKTNGKEMRINKSNIKLIRKAIRF